MSSILIPILVAVVPTVAAASIGELFATEFAVKVPLKLREMKVSGHKEITDDLIISLKDMDNVRPVSSVMEWFYYRIKDVDRGQVRKALDETFDEVVKDLLEFEFVQQWRSPVTLRDEAVRALSSPWLRWLPSAVLDRVEAEDLLPLILGSGDGADDPAKGAHVEAAYNESVWRDNSNIRYVLYGHTHKPQVEALDMVDGREVVYVNTGTWRNRIRKTVPFSKVPNFVTSKQMTYTVFYRGDEDPGKQPGTISFDAWTGTKIKGYR